MFGNNRNNQNAPAGQSRAQETVTDSFYGLATCLAALASLLMAPQLYEFSDYIFFDYMEDAFGEEFLAHLGVIGVTGISTVATYHFSKAALVIALLLIGQRVIFMFA